MHAARHQHREPRSSLEQRGDLGRGRGDLFEIVQHEQNTPVADHLRDGSDELATMGDAEHLGDGWDYQIGIGDRRE